MSDPDDALFNAINEALTRGCCYYCGDKAEGRIEGSCQGAYCPRCGISLVATSYFLPIREDRTCYHIQLRHADARNLRHIRTLARLTHRNYLQTRDLIDESWPLIAQAFAPEILDAKKALDAAGIAYTITPPYPYDDDGEKRGDSP
jgi:hypothetical protein